MMGKRRNRRVTGKHRLSTVEQLERRQLMSVDLQDVRLAKNWTPATEQVQLSQLSLPASFAASRIDWKQALAPQANRLFPDGSADQSFRITDTRYDQSTGATYVYLQQTLNGLDVVNAYANVTVLNGGQVFNAYSSFVPAELAKTAQSKLIGVSPEQALANVAQEYGWTGLNVSNITRSSTTAFGKQAAALRATAIAHAEVPFESVYIPRREGGLDLAWRLNVQAAQGDAWLDATVSATTGEVLFVADWNSDAQYTVFALPKESPSDGGRTTLTDPNSTVHSPLGWHDTNGVAGAESQLTTGNNTIAYRDTDANNLPDPGSSPSGGASLVFNPALDLSLPPASNAEASTVNLFYVTNVAHDVFAAKGFDAAAGNFQVNNYGAGGLGGDPLLAEDRDGSGTNNANMATPPDGISPRMQMFDWTLTPVARSGSFDNGVIVHEFGHGVTNRLTGGPANSSALDTLQAGGMGEGWSDFFALIFTQVATDTASQGRGIGTYVLGEPSTGLGIRNQRYSYDTSINTYTFADIVGLDSVHAIGEIWATTLWDLNWALINGSALSSKFPHAGLGFNANLSAATGGNNMALRLVVQALKLQPANPTFLEARDAILQADVLLNAGLYQQTIWEVFARRGMGVSAVAGDSDSTDVIEAFDTPVFSQLVYRREGLLGSNLSRVIGETLPILVAGGERSFEFTAETESKVSFTLTPDNASAALTARIVNAANAVMLGPITAAAGARLSLPTWTVGASGTYRLIVSSSLPTGMQLESARNAALESQVGDSSFSAEQNISASQRVYNTGNTNSVIGRSEGGYRVVRGNSASKFVDISTTGTPVFVTDESTFLITSTVGNSYFPAGTVTIADNGGIWSTARSLTYINAPIADFPVGTPPGLFPLWDDLDDGTIYWQELPVNGINTLVVQWHNRPRFSGIGAATFQVQVPASGSVVARFAYQDVIFGSSFFDNGAGATVGGLSTDHRFQYSLNTPSILDNDFIEVTRLEDIDEYRFNGVAGQRVGVALDAIGLAASQLGGTFMRLLDASNNVLATASTRPLGSTSTVANYDLGLVNYVLPSTGAFSVRIYGRASFDYYLSITKNLALDTENSSGSTTPRYTVALPGATLGHMSSTDVRDLYAFQLNVGQRVQLTLTRPDDDAGVSPVNNLAPRLGVTRPSGAAAVSSTTFNTAGQIIVSYTAVESGQHLIDVRRLSGAGVYAVRAQLITAPALEGEGALASHDQPLTIGSNAQLSDRAAALTTTSIVAPMIERPAGSTLSWHNALQPVDVNGDNRVTALDALLLINEINYRRLTVASSQLPPRTNAAVDQFFDANDDGSLTPLDALLVLDHLNRQRR